MKIRFVYLELQRQLRNFFETPQGLSRPQFARVAVELHPVRRKRTKSAFTPTLHGKSLFTAAIFILATASGFAQATGDFRSHQSGNWNATSSWERWSGSAWVTPAPNAPTSADGVVTVQSNHVITVTSNVTVDQVTINVGGQVTVSNGITWTINDGAGTDLTVNGILNNLGTVAGVSAPQLTFNGTVINAGPISTGSTPAFGSGSLYQHNQNGGAIVTATWNTGSTCEIIGITTTVPAGLSQTFYNFTWSCTNQTANITLAGTPTTVNGNFTVNATGTAQLIGTTGGTGWTLALGGDLDINGGYFTYSGGTGGTQTLNLAGSYNQLGGTFDCTNTGSTLTFNLNGTANSFTQSGGTLNTSRMNFAIPGGSSITLNNNLTVASGRTFTVTGLLNCGANVISGAGTFTVANAATATLGVGSSGGIASSGATGNIQTTTRTFNTGANYTYNGTGTQVTGNGLPATVNNFTNANTGGTVSLTSNLTIVASCVINSGANLDAGNTTITLSAAATPLVVNGTFTPSTSTVTYTSATGANVTGGINYYNLTVNHGGDTFTAANDLTVQNVLTIAASTTFNASSRNITLSGSGTPLVITGTFTPATSTIVYTSASGATVTGTTFNNLTINGTGTFALGAPATVNSTLTLSNGILATGANLVILPAAGTTSGASAASYINGNLQKSFNVGNPQSFTFPIGDGGNYLPLGLASMNVTHAGGLTASTTGSEHPSISLSDIDSTVDVNRYWTLSASNSFAGTYNATFNYNSSDLDGSAVPANFVIRRFTSPTNWTAATVSGTPTSTSAAMSGQNAFGDFAIGDAKSNQTITFPSPGNQTYGVAPIALGATASSGLTVSYTVTSGPATVSNSTLTITSNGSITITASQAGDTHYSAASNVSQTIAVAQKNLTVNGVTASNKVYNANTTATVVTNGATLVGVVGGDTVTLTGTASGTFSDKNVGTNKTVTVSGLTLGGTSAGKYTLTQPSTTANITQANLTVTATGSNRVYNATTTATVTLADNHLGTDSITASYTSASFADKIAVNGKTVSVSGISISGADVGNYNLVNTTATTTANINKASITVTATATNKVYDKTTAASVALADNRVAGDVLTDNFTAATFSSATVGTNKTVTVSGISITGTDAANYTLSSTTATTTANISTATLTISGITATNKVYNHTTAATLSGTAALVGVFSGDTVNLGGTPTATFSDKNVGTNKTVTVTGYTISGTSAANYSLTQPTLSANITTAGLTVGGVTANSKTYDGGTVASLNTGSASLVGVFSGDVVTLNTSGAAGAFADKNIGTNKTVTVSGLAINGTDSIDYTLTQPTATANISAAPLTPSITANDKVYDRTTTAAIATRSLTGVVNPDVVNLISGTANFNDMNVGTNKAVVATGLSLSGAGAGNYVLSSTSATNTASISAATVTGTITASDKVYDGTTVAGIATRSLTGVIDPDAVNLTGGTATFDSKNVGTGKTVTATGLALSGADAGNYQLSSDSATNTASIAARALTISGVTASKVYDGNNTAPLNFSGASFSNLVSGDDVTFDATGTSGMFANKVVGNGKPVTVTGVTISGGDSTNYAFSQPAATGNITTRALSLTATGVNKIYDATTTATVTFSDDRVGGDVVNVSYSAAFDDKNVGNGKNVSVTGIGISGADSLDYSLPSTTASTTADITAAPLSITANDANRLVGTNNPAFTGTITGVLGSDNITATYSTMATNDSPAGNYPITPAALDPGNNIGNYSLVTTNGTLSVNPLVAQWSTNDGGNGHYFQAILAPHGITWDDAQAAAAARNGYLATISSASENAFIFGQISNTSDFWLADNSGGDGPWIGGAVGAGQTSPTNWAWVNGDSFSYSNWDPTQPDNAGSNQDHIQFYSSTALTGDTWNDLANNDVQHVRGYVIEFNLDPNRLEQTITFNALSNVTYGDAPVAVNATASSGLAVSFSIVSGPATISGNNVTIRGVGTVVVRASQGGDSTWNPASDVDQSFAVGPKTLSVTLTAASKPYDATTAASIMSRVLNGVVGSDDVSAVAGTANFSDKNVATGKTVTETGLSLGGTMAGDYQLASTTATTTADITAIGATVTGVTANSRIYDRTTTATLSGVPALFGVIDGDDVVLGGTPSANFGDKTVGVGKAVTVGGFTIGGADAGNYLLSQPVGLTADITTAGLGITGVSANSKPYDGSTTATLSGTPLLVGVIGADDATLGGTPAANFGDSAAGIAKPVFVSGYTISGGDAVNYALSQPVGLSANISPITLNVAGITASNKVYDGTAVASLNTSGASLVGVIGSDTVSLDASAATGAFADKNVGTNKTVTVNGLNLNDDDGNYILPTTTATASITTASLTVTGVTADNKIYDGTTNATLSGTAALSGIIGLDDVTVSGTATASFADKLAADNKPVTVSGYTTSGADAGNYSLHQPAGLTANITPATLTASITATNKIYDATTVATIASRSVSGVVSPDVVSAIGGTAAFDDKNVANGKNVTTSGLTLSGADAGNYVLSANPVTTTANITAASLTVSGITASNKVYDGTTVAALNTGSAALISVLGTDVVNLDVSAAAGVFADKDAGTIKVVTVSGLAINGTDSSNYSLTQPTANADITVATLTVTAVDSHRILGAANPVFTAAYSGFLNGDDTNVLSGAPSLTTAADTNSPVGDYPIVAAAGDLSATDYSFAFVNGTLKVLPVETLFFDDFVRSTNPGPLTPWVAQSGNWTVTDGMLEGGPNPFTSYSFAHMDTNWADYAVQAQVQIPATNGYGGGIGGRLDSTTGAHYAAWIYPEGSPEPTTAGKLALVKFSDWNTWGYMGSNLAPMALVNLPGVGTNAHALKLKFSGNLITVYFDGTQMISMADAEAQPYTSGGITADMWTQFDPYQLRVDNVLVTSGTVQNISFGALTNHTYGDAPFAVSATASSGLPVSFSIASGPATVSNNLVTITGTGLVTIRASQAGDANYAAAPDIDQSFTVNPASLSVAADSQSKIYGSANPTLTGNLTGVVNSDNITASYTTLATASTSVGGYDITPVLNDPDSRLTNYSVTSSNATLTVTTASLSVAADNQSKTYGSINPALTGNLTGVVNGDNITVTYSTAATTSSPVGGYAITPVLNDPDVRITNYSVLSSNGTLTINAASLSVSADNQNKIYGSANPTLTGTLTGIVNSDNITASYTTAATTSSPVAGYDITPVLNDPDVRLTNYTVASHNGTLTVNPASLTGTVNPQSRSYGAANPAFSINYSGFVNSENSGIVSGSLTFACVDTNNANVDTNTPAGAYPITVVSGQSAPNYNISYIPGSLTITPASLLVQADHKSRAYGAANPVLTASYLGFVNGESNNVLAGSPDLSTSADTNSPVGTYDIVAAVGTLSNANYSLSFSNGTFTVTVAGLTVAADNQKKTYGEANPALTGSLTGVLAGDNITATYTTAATASSTVGAYNITPVLNDADSKLTNYTVVSSNGTLTINPASLSVAADSQSKIYGSANPILTGTLSGVVNSDNITASYSTAAIGSSPAGGYDITPLLNDPDTRLTNYTVTSSNGTLTVTTASLSVAADNQSKTYGSVNPALTGNLTGVVNGDNITASYTTLATASTSVGGYDITPVLNDPDTRLTNYTVTSSNGTLTVTTASLSIAADNQSKTYGSVNPVLTGSLTGVVNGDNITVTYSTAATATSPVGGYDITPLLNDPDVRITNYSVLSSNGTLTINPASLTGTVNPQSRSYGAANPAFSVNYSGFVNSENSGLVSGSLTFACVDTNDANVDTNTPVGVYPVTVVSGQSAPNYNISYVPGSLTITPASLLVQADNKSRAYGAANPVLTASYIGLVNGESNNVLAGTPDLSTGADTNSPVGTYDIVAAAGTLSNANYSMSFSNGTLTVTVAALTVTADNQTKTYGAANPTLTGSLTGVLSGDNITATYTTAATTSSTVGAYDVTPVLNDPNSKLTNYTVISSNGTLTINPASLSVAADSQSKIYGSANPTLTGTLSGVVNSDNITASYTTVATASSPVGGYDITPLLNDPDSRLTNYSVSSSNGTLTINPASLSVAADNQTKTFGAANPTLTGTLTGVISGDEITADYTTVATTSSPVGAYDITPVLNDPNNRLANYSVASSNGTLTVTAAMPSITWVNPADIVYGTPLSAAQLNASASVAGNLVYTPPAGTMLNAGMGQVLSVTLNPTDLDYNSASATVSINVLPAGSSMIVSTSTNSALPGASVTFTATLAAVAPGAGMPTGSVQFIIDGSPVGTPAALSGGVATLSTSSLAHGSHTVSATYAGNGNFTASSNSLAGNQVINTPPQAGGYALATTVSTPVSFTENKLLQTITDADNDSVKITDVSATSTNGGTVVLENGMVTFTPVTGSTAVDYFSYTATDALGGSVTGIVTVTMTAAPAPSGKSVTVLANGHALVQLTGAAGDTYMIQGSADLQNWVNLGRVVARPDGSVLIEDADAPDFQARYYRVVNP